MRKVLILTLSLLLVASLYGDRDTDPRSPRVDSGGGGTAHDHIGTANQVNIAGNGTATVTFSTPQDIDTSADVEFDSLTLDDLTASRLLATSAAKLLISSDLVAWVAGTAGDISVTDDGDGSITISSLLWRLEATDNFFGPQSAAADFTSGDYNTVGGVEAANKLTSNDYNTVFGYQAMYNAAGNSNTVFGYQAMLTAATAQNNSNNVVVGTLAGQLFEDGDYNIFLGSLAGQEAIQGDGNIAIGQNALDTLGTSGTDANKNIGIGYRAGYIIDDGQRNILIGDEAGYAITDGSFNISMGRRALSAGAGDNNIGIGDDTFNYTGDYNVAVGHYAFSLGAGTGDGNTGLGTNAGKNFIGTSSKNVCIGFGAGPDPASGSDNSNKLYINNEQSDTPLIYGDFATNAVTINGTLTATGGIVAGDIDFADSIAGTANQITVTDDGDNTVTLSTPQDLDTAANFVVADLNTGQGAYELYAMNQDVESTDAVTFATVDTGQGANELYDMDQNVDTGASPTFVDLTLTGGSTLGDTQTINFVAGSAAFTTYAAQAVNLDVDDLVATSIMHGLDFNAIGTTTGEVTAIGTNGDIKPIHQHIGTYIIPVQTEYAARWTGSWTDGVDGFQCFVADTNEIYIGSATKFSSLEVMLTVVASHKIGSEFYFYDTAGPEWVEFFPADGTDEFRQDGIISWDSGDLTDWNGAYDPGGASGSTGYYIAIKRNKVLVATPPTPTTIKLLEPTEYEWDENGDLDVNDIEMNAGNIEGETKHLRFNLFGPNAIQVADNEFCIWPVTDAAITITGITVTLDAITNEILGDLKYADTFIGLASSAVINDFDTTSGVRVDTSISSAAVAAGKAIYLSFDSAPNVAITQACFDITYSYD